MAGWLGQARHPKAGKVNVFDSCSIPSRVAAAEELGNLGRLTVVEILETQRWAADPDRLRERKRSQ